jgi:hypothetical protein
MGGGCEVGSVQENGKTQAHNGKGEPAQFFNPEVSLLRLPGSGKVGPGGQSYFVGKKRKASTKDCFPEHNKLENLIEIKVDAREVAGFLQTPHAMASVSRFGETNK